MAGHLAIGVFFKIFCCFFMWGHEWLGSFFIESTLSCMCAEGLLFASIGVKNVLLS